MPDRDVLLEFFNAGLAAVDPYHAVLKTLRLEGGQLRAAAATYTLGDFRRILVVGAGKATARMALAIEALLGDKISCGLIVVKEGHREALNIIEQVESAHPLPAAAGEAATRRILQLLRDADEQTLVLCLLSGGASALLVAPVEGLSLQNKIDTTHLLLQAGASIAELNAVRKHLSSVKGGRLAQAASPARLLTLILSDVIGDPLEVIASGPTVADSSTFSDAWSALMKYGLAGKIPAAVHDYLRQGMAGKKPETLKGTEACFGSTQQVIVGSLQQALQAVQEKIARAGFISRLLTASLQGEAREAARMLAQLARSELAQMQAGERRFLLSGGETTVSVRGGGRGGRNQELALAFAIEMEGIQGVTLLSVATDGSDGPTDAAGALVDGDTAMLARNAGMDTFSYLERNDSYAFFQQLDALTGAQCHLITGPTGTNVMDMQLIHLLKS